MPAFISRQHGKTSALLDTSRGAGVRRGCLAANDSPTALAGAAVAPTDGGTFAGTSLSGLHLAAAGTLSRQGAFGFSSADAAIRYAAGAAGVGHELTGGSLISGMSGVFRGLFGATGTGWSPAAR